jgi:hypothetical protein
VSDIDTVVVDSLKALDPERPIREADIPDWAGPCRFRTVRNALDHLVGESEQNAEYQPGALSVRVPK